jgi:hypothetical protein
VAIGDTGFPVIGDGKRRSRTEPPKGLRRLTITRRLGMPVVNRRWLPLTITTRCGQALKQETPLPQASAVELAITIIAAKASPAKAEADRVASLRVISFILISVII